MRFIIDEDLPRSILNLLQQYNHDAVDVRDIGLRGTTDYEIAAYAKKTNRCILTGDYDFSDNRNYPPKEYCGIVVLNLPKISTASFIRNLLESFLQKNELVEQISGKLAIVEPGQIRIRKG